MDRKQVIEGFRLSPQQRRVWLLQQGSRAYHAQCAILIEGVLDKEALKNAIRMTVERHEILRTTFQTEPASGNVFPIQVINHNHLSLFLKEKEFAGEESRIEEIFFQLRQAAGEPDTGPTLETLLLTVSQSKHFLLIDLPALCADHATLRNLLDELIRCYQACVEGKELPDEPLQYADIAEWQNELLEAEDTEFGRTYWRKQNFAASLETRLPYERQSPLKGEFAAQLFAERLDAVLLEQSETLAARCDVSLAVVLLGAWRVLLWRLSRDAHVVVGIANDGRKFDETRSALGLLTKYLPVQQELSETMTVGDVLHQLGTWLGESWKYQEYFSWEGIVPTENSVPFMPFLFSFEQHTAKLKVRDAGFSLGKEYVCLDQFKVELFCNRTEEALNVEFHYDSRYFDPQSIQRLAAQFNQLLRSVNEDAATAIGDLNILSTTERRQLLKDFNKTAAVYPSDQVIHQLFEQQAARTPENRAVFFAGQHLTYAELNARANQLAHALRKSGIGPETCIGIFMGRSVEMIVGLLGVLKAGAAFVPLNPDYPAARLLKQLEEIQTPVLLTQEQMLDRLPDFDGELFCLDLNEELGQSEDEDNLKWTGTPEQAAYVIYTSGSTGTPKGVVVSHRNLMNYTHDICEKLRVGPARANGYLNFATVSTLSADLGNTCIFPSLVSGGCLHIIPYDVATDAKLFSTYAARHPLDVLKIVPSHLRQLLSTVEGSGILPRRFLITGGEALNIELAQQINRIGAGCQLINHYGPTETTIGSAVNTEIATTLESAGDNGRAGSVPIGRAIANTSLYVLDEKWRVVPLRVVGELYIGGAGVARGYLGQAAETAAKFLPDPYRGESGARMYRTGDLARSLDDGQIEFLGRIDDQIKVRGYRVELGEIETALLQHPGVSQATVIARSDVASVSPLRLLAYFVPSSTNGDDNAPSVADLRRHLSQLLPDYMIPHSIIRLSHLPLTANGKLDRRALPDSDVSAVSEGTESRPRTAAEQILTSIWSEVLGVRRLSLHDNFFELGGDSIVSIQIVSRAKQAGLHLTPRLLFQFPTISQLAAAADHEQPKILAEQGAVSGNVLLTPIVHRFIEQQLSEPHHYNQTVLLQLRRQYQPRLIATALAHLVAHHDSLRLRLRHSEQGWKLWNEAKESNDYFTTVDLSHLSAAEQSTAIETESAKWQASLNLAEGPLLRVVYFDCGLERGPRLLWVVHHLCVDGVSWRILLEDLQRCCEQLAAGQEVSLGEKTTSFQQWAEQLEKYAETEDVRAQLSYWADQVRHGVPELPVNSESDENRMESVRNVSVELSAEETSWLLQQVGEAYGTRVEEVLLTGLAESIRRWNGAGRILVDMEGHGREEISPTVDVSRTVGWFTTHYPLMLEIGNHVNESAALKLVKEQVRSLPERGLGYGLLRYMTKDAEVRQLLRGLPQPEMSFNYLGQFDQSIGESSIFAATPESSGPNRSQRHKRVVKLAINASVVGGQLQVTWTYSEGLHERVTIEQLAHHYIDSLRRLIEHCRSPEAGGFTPSDFPDADLSQEELDHLIAKFG